MRRTLRIPYRTHRYLLPLLVKSKSFHEQHFSRLNKFIATFMNSCNAHVSLIAKRACFKTTGALGRNMLGCAAWRKQKEQYEYINDISIAESIRDLLHIREHSSFLDGFNVIDVDAMIMSLCCD